MQTQWQSGQLKHRVADVTSLEYARALTRANKMADRCTSSYEVNSVALRRDYFTKTLVLIQSFAELRRSVGLLVRFGTEWKTLQRMHRGLINAQVSFQYCAGQ